MCPSVELNERLAESRWPKTIGLHDKLNGRNLSTLWIMSYAAMEKKGIIEEYWRNQDKNYFPLIPRVKHARFVFVVLSQKTRNQSTKTEFVSRLGFKTKLIR